MQYKGKLSQEYDKVYDVSSGILLYRNHEWNGGVSLLQWKQFMELGKDIEDSVIEDKIKAKKPEQCAVLIYTVCGLEFIILIPVAMY